MLKDSIVLPSGMVVPFPVETPFAMRPNMRPWQRGEPILIRDEQFPRYISLKRETYEPVFADRPDRELLRAAIGALQRVDSTLLIDSTAEDLVLELTMQMQEDWVLLSPNQSGKLSAQILSVHFPSGWDPRTKAGMTFLHLHEPVADNQLIMQAAGSIGNLISTRGPFIRHVWSIAGSGELSRRPDHIRERSCADISQLWYRCERQTTIPIDGKAVLFLIRVYVVPLTVIFESDDRKKEVIQSINSMSDAVIEYKGYRHIRQFLAQQVDA